MSNIQKEIESGVCFNPKLKNKVNLYQKNAKVPSSSKILSNDEYEKSLTRGPVVENIRNSPP
jgi:hypothetical protein